MEKMAEMEQVEVILNNQGENFYVIVDLLTANELLNDPLKADQFVEQIRQEGSTSTRFQEPVPGTSRNNCTSERIDKICASKRHEALASTRIQEPVPGTSHSNNNCSVEKIHKIWTSKRPTQEDLDATELFLKLRAKNAEKFDDRKTIKSQLWQKIANEMSEMGVFVGEGKEAVEKMRLKFSNMQKQYLLHIKHMKTTGESQKDPPPFFELIHGILGGEDKSNPMNLQDSLEDVTKESEMDCEEETQGASDKLERPCKENDKENIQNRFKKPSQYQSQSQTQRPKSVNVKLLELAASESDDRKKHMSKLEKLLEKQNNQRDALLDKLDKIINVMSRKRSREDSD